MSRDVVALVFHADDELACAGTLARFKESGASVTIVLVNVPDMDFHGNRMNRQSERSVPIQCS